jgi:hypothetical protein
MKICVEGKKNTMTRLKQRLLRGDLLKMYAHFEATQVAAFKFGVSVYGPHIERNSSCDI